VNEMRDEHRIGRAPRSDDTDAQARQPDKAADEDGGAARPRDRVRQNLDLPGS
jgi:hypothetical protein